MSNLYIDMDGVLADFDKGVYELCGKRPDAMSNDELWDKIDSHYDDGNMFFKHLPLMADAMKLWTNIEMYNPVILTATRNENRSRKNVHLEKHWWANLYFNGVEVVTVKRSRDKAGYAGHIGDILIDDRLKSIDPWVEAGGTGILHTSAIDTLKKLKECGL